MSDLARRGRIARAMVAAAFGVLAVLSAAQPAHADRIRSDQWQLSTLHARSAWQLSTGDGVVVAVLDSGVDAHHPDLVGQVLPGADFVDGSTDGRDDLVGHGTTVAALIAGRFDDRSGVVGLAPRARILPVRVLDQHNAYQDDRTVARALRWAVQHGAQVINMSLGGLGRSPDLVAAVRYALSHDVVVVACTGNVTQRDPDQIWYPAREPGVLAVTGLAEDNPADPAQLELWSGALTGQRTALAAPAATLLGARPGGYWQVEGTSFAAPLVSATAALIRARYPELNAANVINRLVATAADLGAPGRDEIYGYGEVNPVAALTAALPTVTANPLLATAGREPAPTTDPTGKNGGGDAATAARAAGPVAPGPVPAVLAGWLAAEASAATALVGTMTAAAVLRRRRRGEE